MLMTRMRRPRASKAYSVDQAGEDYADPGGDGYEDSASDGLIAGGLDEP